jgi:Peptidase family M23
MRPTFRYPFAGDYPVTSGFGPRDGGFHTGTDFGLPFGTPVLAANDGVVIYAAREDEAGNTITISGADGWQSRYLHLNYWLVSVGQTVHAGELVAVSNNTGDSTGPHLHFEIRTDPSTPVDPVPILIADSFPTPPTPAPQPLEPDVDQYLYSCTIKGTQRWFRCTGTGYLCEVSREVAVALGPFGAGSKVVTLEAETGAYAWNQATKAGTA